MLFAFAPDFMRSAQGGRGRRLPRVLLYAQFLPAVTFPMPAMVAEFFQAPLMADRSVRAELPSSGPATKNVLKDVPDGVKLASVAGAALVNPASPVTARGIVVSSQSRVAVPVGAKFRVLATAYSSTPDQTDSSPFITANGTHVHDGTVAANFLPFGTRVRFSNYRPDMVFTVEDRHSRRLSDRVDIWFTTRGAARQFGKRVLDMEIVE